MNTKTVTSRRPQRLIVALSLILIAVSATAQTVGSAEELREALKKELAPLRLSLKDQAKAVATELAEGVINELASTMNVSAPQPKFARRDGASNEKDPS